MANLRDFKVGDILLTYGLDMDCHKCVCKTQVVSIDERGIVTDDGDCRMITTWENMEYANDYFLYSAEQEKVMQEYCDNEHNKWHEDCRKQLERARQYHNEWTARLKDLIKEKGYFDGTHTIVDLSGNDNFFRWKKYDILHINEELEVFGMAEDEETMFLSINDLCVPTQQRIEKEVENA